LMYCGLPVGAIFVAGLATFIQDIPWQTLFLIGGISPLILLPFMAWILRDQPKVQQSAAQPQTEVPSMGNVLFAEQRYKQTLPLWLSFFFTLMINYILISWLPNLLMEQGLEKQQAFMIMMLFQVGAVAGTLGMGYLLDRLKLWHMAIIIYTGLLVAIVLLFTTTSIPLLIFAGLLGGIFSTGGQSILYGISPIFYSNAGKV